MAELQCTRYGRGVPCHREGQNTHASDAALDHCSEDQSSHGALQGNAGPQEEGSRVHVDTKHEAMEEYIGRARTCDEQFDARAADAAKPDEFRTDVRKGAGKGTVRPLYMMPLTTLTTLMPDIRYLVACCCNPFMDQAVIHGSGIPLGASPTHGWV